MSEHDANAEMGRLERERDVLRLRLDAVRGLATGQPGSDPSSSDQGWSPALCAVKAVLRERDAARAEAERLARGADVYREAWHIIESALAGADDLSPKHSPEEARDFILRAIRERDDARAEAEGFRRRADAYEEESRRMAELLVKYHEILKALTTHATTWRANGWLPTPGAVDDAEALLAMWPEVRL